MLLCEQQNALNAREQSTFESTEPSAHDGSAMPGSVADACARVWLAKCVIAMLDIIDVDCTERRLRLLQPHDFAFAADLQDLVAAHRDGVRHRAEIAGEVDLRVVDDEVDGATLVGALRSDDQSGNQRRPDDGGDEDGGKTRGHGGRPDSIIRAAI